MIPIIVGIVIVLYTKNKIKDLLIRKSTVIEKIESEGRASFFEVSDNYSAIVESNTYLIYQKKSDFLGKCENYIQNISNLDQDRESFSIDTREFFTESYEAAKKQRLYVTDYNENFVQKRLTEYQDLFKKSPFPLDENQRRAVIVDDKHNLVIAGAGAGKTEVLITRIAYLISRKPDTINPERILALAFQNKAAQEMRDRLQERFGFDVKIKTFHALGKEILEKASATPPQLMFNGHDAEAQYQHYVAKIFNEIKNTPEFQKNLLRYIVFFGDNFIIKAETDFSKKEEFYQYMQNLSYTALNGTKVKSEAERTILNFLLTHAINGKDIRGTYESPANWITYFDAQGKKRSPRPDFFLNDFDIYIEHWAVDRNGKVPSWFTGPDASKKYTDSMKYKRDYFSRQKKYSLIETFNWEYKDPAFLEKFQERLLKTLQKKIPGKEFTIVELNTDVIIKKVWRDCKESIDDLSKNVADFIVIAKTYNLTPENIKNRLSLERWTPRQYAFAAIAVKLYKRYEEDLRTRNCIDFSDMINLAVQELNIQENLYKNTFDHILIDEYQDISTQRYNLIKVMMAKNKECKLFCVGDDWQSIMGFTGFNLDFFVNFERYFDHPARTDLTINYRSCKSIVDLGADIIKQNASAQIHKESIAHNSSKRQIKVYSSILDPRDWMQSYEQTTAHCVDRISDYLSDGYKPEDILILARIVKHNVLERNLYKYGKMKKISISTELNNPHHIHFMSVHKSKGLQASVVFILDVVKGLYGFPCEKENPDIFEPAILGPKRKREEEERRIFYVAATRAKEALIIYTKKQEMSDFLQEIKEHLEVEEI
ncbi:MAG: UvrD-helicase domain-containing protein [Methanoregula sp.]